MSAAPAERLPVPAAPGRLAELRQAVRSATFQPESARVDEMLRQLAPLAAQLEDARARATRWVEVARGAARTGTLIDSLLEQFPLDSVQGRALMSLAEALLRTPDPQRADQLIAERLRSIAAADEARDADDSEDKDEDPFLIRAGLTVLGITGRMLPQVAEELDGSFTLASVAKPVLAPALRFSLRRAMRTLGHAFIVGETIESALARGASAPGLALCSFDVLGEGARTDADAARYAGAYARAIDELGARTSGPVHARSGISVKLSALEPRYALVQSTRLRSRLIPCMLELARRAARHGIGLTIDAEEADRLDISLEIIEALARDPATREWEGLGLAVQAYGRRAAGVIDWVAALARESGRRMSVRLVKGAYWDSEIKRAQERGLPSFPVYTAKAATDVSYLACAQRLFAAQDVLYPQFATHNALTIASVLALAPPGSAYEFQRLHGMGETLYAAIRADARSLPPVRVYAPVGTHQDLLPYLVRRLLENGANTSFVHHFLNPRIPVERVVSDPVAELKQSPGPAPGPIREPDALYAPDRRNSRGADFGDPDELARLQDEIRAHAREPYAGGPLLAGAASRDPDAPIVSPADTRELVGRSRDATAAQIARALDAGARAQPRWDAQPAAERAACLTRAADLLEARRSLYLSLLVREAGRTLPDAIAELREAADFCRYYAARGVELFAAARELPGPTGERNLLSMQGRGVFVCISPWNFPLAIFTGQVVAALMAGNAVVAKPAPATPLVAHAMTRLLHEAGVPEDVLQLTPADGPAFGAVAFSHPALAGVAFTGSTATATRINRALAAREGPILPLIAETGGVNAMIVDATALPEQVVDDAVTSAFTSAGQRCSALRVLYVQEEIADEVIEMLVGAMRTLTIGDPAVPETDVGPVISAQAAERLQAYAQRLRSQARLLHACPLGPQHQNGHFVAPQLFELHALDQVKSEEFGPILHVARYRAAQLPAVLEAIRSTGYGLTLGVHSRVESLADHVFRSLPVGNTYVNRNMIGAVVGVQPFGGQGLSGTGPKAGGPHYLQRFATERTLTINTVAIGGNVELLS